MPLLQLTPATSIDDVYKTLANQPLSNPAEMAAFWYDLGGARGGRHVERVRRDLARALDGSLFKGFLMGHPGSGKSTEITRLLEAEELRTRVCPVRFSVVQELDPSSFEPVEVLELMLMRLIEETHARVGRTPGESALRPLQEWLEPPRDTHVEDTVLAGQIEAGIGLGSESWWAKLFARARGEARFASTHRKERVDRRLQRISELIRLANGLVSECGRLLDEAQGARWLFIGEDFDKPAVPVPVAEKLFLHYAGVLSALDAHMLFSLPISLAYSAKAPGLPFAADRQYMLPDTPVFDPQHRPHAAGRQALHELLSKRVAPGLFADGQMKALIIASGGNLRDLFRLTLEAAESALDEERKSIVEKDVRTAQNMLRSEYERLLGESPFDDHKGVTYTDKAEKLVAVHKGARDANVPDVVLHTLLRSRAVQEFNGERWFGVHPLVVDLLKRQGRLQSDVGGPVLGGTDDPAA